MEYYPTLIDPNFVGSRPFQHFPADRFPLLHPVHWLHSHFAVGGISPLHRLSGMITAHMTHIAPHNGFTFHSHRGLEIYTWVLEGTLYHEDTTGGKGEIGPGELQRMFAGDYIAHQELNRRDEPVRVIQIWYLADRKYRGVAPHYQQLRREELPARQVGDATVYGLIGEDSPMEQHMTGRLTATSLEPGGTTPLEGPGEGEELFLYVTDGGGTVLHDGLRLPLNQYDVILVRPDAVEAQFMAEGDRPLRFLNFYLPPFLRQG